MGKRRRERESERARERDHNAEIEVEERTNERANERTVVPWSCYGAGERRKQSVRLISAAGADKAFVHSPTASCPVGV